MNIKIEEMKLEHIEQIQDILASDFDEFWNENILRKELENPASTYIVAVDEQNNVLGYGGIWQPIDEAHITNIVTKKDKRGQQIGTTMLERLIKIAQQRNLKSITLEVNVNNKPAIHLYEKYQFQQVGIRKKYYHNTEDAFIMTLDLSSDRE